MKQLRQTSKEIMDSGLDEWLGKVFGQLTELVKVMSDMYFGGKYLVGVIKETVSKFNELTGSNTLLTIVMLVLIGRFKGIAMGIRLASRLASRNAGVIKVLAALFRGVFGKALAMVILRFTIWGTAILAVSKLLSHLGKELKRDKLGGWTIFDEMALKVDMLKLKMEGLGLRWEITKQNFANWADSPIRYHSGDTASGHIRRFFGFEDALNNPTVRVDRSKDIRTQKPSPYSPIPKANNVRDIMNNISGNRSASVPIPFSREASVINNHIYVDGDLSKTVSNTIR